MADQLLTGTTLVEKETRSIGDVPIGSILSWAKTMSGVPTLPSSFVECNGQVLVDANSTLNGQTIPDLNGDNRFLRGKTTSGGTGGSETHNHIQTLAVASGGICMSSAAFGIGGNIQPITNSAAAGSVGGSINLDATSSTSTLPTYYEIVWIMRIK